MNWGRCWVICAFKPWLVIEDVAISTWVKNAARGVGGMGKCCDGIDCLYHLQGHFRKYLRARRLTCSREFHILPRYIPQVLWRWYCVGRWVMSRYVGIVDSMARDDQWPDPNNLQDEVAKQLSHQQVEAHIFVEKWFSRENLARHGACKVRIWNCNHGSRKVSGGIGAPRASRI